MKKKPNGFDLDGKKSMSDHPSKKKKLTHHPVEMLSWFFGIIVGLLTIWQVFFPNVFKRQMTNNFPVKTIDTSKIISKVGVQKTTSVLKAKNDTRLGPIGGKKNKGRHHTQKIDDTLKTKVEALIRQAKKTPGEQNMLPIEQKAYRQLPAELKTIDTNKYPSIHSKIQQLDSLFKSLHLKF